MIDRDVKIVIWELRVATVEIRRLKVGANVIGIGVISFDCLVRLEIWSVLGVT